MHSSIVIMFVAFFEIIFIAFFEMITNLHDIPCLLPTQRLHAKMTHFIQPDDAKTLFFEQQNNEVERG